MIRNAFCQTNRLFNLLERAEKEICFSMANGTFKMKMDIDRHGPRPMRNSCKNLNPPNFSLPSTFKEPVCLVKIQKLEHYSFLMLARRTKITQDKIFLRYEKSGDKLGLLFFINNAVSINLGS